MTQETTITVRVKALRDAAKVTCGACEKEWLVSKKFYFDQSFAYIHSYGDGEYHECEAGGIWELIEQAKAEEREAGERKDELLILLRDLCGEFGDNDWPDELNRADALEKHFLKYIWKAQLDAVNGNHAAAIEWLKGNSMAEVAAERAKVGIEEREAGDAAALAALKRIESWIAAAKEGSEK